jgi:hypothetical protein
VAAGLSGFHGAGDLNGSREQQQLFGQRGFAGIRVGNDGEGAAATGFGSEGQNDFPKDSAD